MQPPTLTRQQRDMEIVKLRTRLSFLYGDETLGGPSHEHERMAILLEIDGLKMATIKESE